MVQIIIYTVEKASHFWQLCQMKTSKLTKLWKSPTSTWSKSHHWFIKHTRSTVPIVTLIGVIYASGLWGNFMSWSACILFSRSEEFHISSRSGQMCHSKSLPLLFAMRRAMTLKAAEAMPRHACRNNNVALYLCLCCCNMHMPNPNHTHKFQHSTGTTILRCSLYKHSFVPRPYLLWGKQGSGDYMSDFLVALSQQSWFWTSQWNSATSSECAHKLMK